MSERAYLVAEQSVEIETGDDVGVRWRTLTSADRTPTGQLTSGVCEIEPGGKLDLHRHPPLELYHFLAGSGVVTLGDEEHRVGPGDTISIPGNCPHAIRNDGTTLLKLFYVFPVDSFSEVVYTNL